MKKKKIICFDLDGTLAPSKEVLDNEMADLINKLLEKYYVSVITWWGVERFQRQIFDVITDDNKLLSKFIACPTCGTKMFKFENWKWVKIYNIWFSKNEQNLILNTLCEVIDSFGLKPKKVRWNLIENRWSQITYSALWHEAPLKEKLARDPNFQKRKVIQAELQKRLPNFSVNCGWSTSIDITMKWVNKAFCVIKLAEYFNVNLDEILFVWDAVFPEWNDYPPYTIWVDSVKVNSVEHTKEIIRRLIEGEEMDEEWLYGE